MAAQDDDAQSALDAVPNGLRMKQEARHDTPTGSNGKAPTGDTRPPAKRSRKAINCEPCRASKLKCDRYLSFSPFFLSPPFHIFLDA